MNSDVDLDRLADFAGGALDGTADEIAVRDLIATDPAWAQAYTALVAANATISAELRALGADDVPAEPTPADVVARLDRALRAVAAGTAGPAEPERSARRDAGSPLVAVPDLPPARPVDRTVSSISQARRRRRLTIALSTAAAVVALAFASVVAVPMLTGGTLNRGLLTTGDGGSGREDTAAGTAPALAGQVRVIASGHDYRPETLGTVAQRAGQEPPLAAAAESGSAKSRTSDQPAASAANAPPTVPDQLSRLRDPVARAACFAAVVARYAGGWVSAADFAEFQGQPALVLVLEEAPATSGRSAVVVGPDCGLTATTTDQRYLTVI